MQYYAQEKEKEIPAPKPPEKIEIPKSKKEKTIVYKLAESSSSSDSSSDDEEEKVVYVKKVKNKSKKQIYHKQKKYEQQSSDIPQERQTLDSTLYKSSQEMLHKRAIEERVRANLIKWNNAMMPQEY